MLEPNQKMLQDGILLADLSRIIGYEPAVLLSFAASIREGVTSLSTTFSGVETRRLLKSMEYHYDVPRTVAFSSLKGGVGKTTSAVTVAARAVQLGFKTCVLDLDPQASASLALDALPPDDAGLVFGNVWSSPSEKVPAALFSLGERFSILPSALDNSLLDIQLSNPAAQKNAVKRVCEAIYAEGFDLVIIDCPPSLGAAVISTICAADLLVVPVAADAFSFKAVEITLEEVSAIRDTFGLPEVPVRILPTMVDRRIKLTEEFLERLRRSYTEMLLPCVIRTSSEYAKAVERGRTIYSNNRKSHAREDYDRVMGHLFGLSCVSEMDGGLHDNESY